MIKNDLYLKALRGETVERPPVWMMRQAGRYHKHYQALRQKYSFMQLCKEPELAAQTALGPIEDFDWNAYEIGETFSDRSKEDLEKTYD